MLDERYYNIKSLQKMSKTRFYTCYEGKLPNVDKVWEWLEGFNKVKKQSKSKK